MTFQCFKFHKKSQSHKKRKICCLAKTKYKFGNGAKIDLERGSSRARRNKKYKKNSVRSEHKLKKHYFWQHCNPFPHRSVALLRLRLPYASPPFVIFFNVTITIKDIFLLDITAGTREREKKMCFFGKRENFYCTFWH